MADWVPSTPARSLGGRFSAATHPVLDRINASIGVDIRLWRQDIAGSKAHAAMLAEVGLITDAERDTLHDGLDRVAAELAADGFEVKPGDEDIHMAVERRLGELVGAPARKLHTGRSRNDQVATDLVLWLRDELAALRARLVELAEVACARAEEAVEVPMPSFTHLQPAQVASVGHWLLGHATEAVAHVRRLDHLLARLDQCPLGSGASAGSYLPLDRGFTATALGFARPSAHSVVSTGSRMDALDALALLAMVGVSLSRLGEELVLFTMPATGWLLLPDALTTGSSLLPQKRNADGAELLRSLGKLPAADFSALASVCSGLVNGYSKDLQHDKAVLFRAWDTISDALDLAILHIGHLAWDAVRLRAACSDDLAALWLADQLVLAGVPFREAHHVVGRAVKLGVDQALDLAGGFEAAVAEGLDLPLDVEMLAERLRGLQPIDLLAALRTEGSAAPVMARKLIGQLREDLRGPVSAA